MCGHQFDVKKRARTENRIGFIPKSWLCALCNNKRKDHWNKMCNWLIPDVKNMCILHKMTKRLRE